MPDQQPTPSVWARPWVSIGLFGAGLIGLVIPLAAHAASQPGHFSAGHDWARFLLPHSVLAALGALCGGGAVLAERRAVHTATRAPFIWWSGVFVFGVCLALFGWAERVIRQSAYDLSAIQITDTLWLLGVRVVFGSLAGWLIGAHLWRRRGGTGAMDAARG